MRTKAGRVCFNRWLAKLDSADVFLTNKRAVIFYKGLNQNMRSRIVKQLRAVDPAGLRRLIVAQVRITREANRHKKAITVPVSETTVVLRREMENVGGVSILKFMDIEGLTGVLAICRAAGYTPAETAAMAGMDINELNSLITQADIKRAMARMPDAVRMAADQIVMRDLLRGKVTDRTEKADRIVDRRTKHALAAHSERRADRVELKELTKARQDHWKDRFGVTVEVEAKEEEVTDEEKEKEGGE